jgi:hypothetical protein
MSETDNKASENSQAGKPPWLSSNNMTIAMAVLSIGVMLNFWKTPEKQMEERLALEARLNKIEAGIQGVQNQVADLSQQIRQDNSSSISMSEFRVWVMELHAKNPSLAVPTVGEWNKKP